MNRISDYSITLQDSTGKTAVLPINGDSVNELIAAGYGHTLAVESVEGNKFAKAIASGLIGDDAVLIDRE